MRQDNLTPVPGWHKDRKRVGRGDGSGRGTFSGKGCKGQKARAGCNMRPGFEGGQLPIIKRLPRKRGFTNIFRTEFAAVNLESLNVFKSGEKVTAEKMVEAGIIKSANQPVKVLGTGEISRKLNIHASAFSAAAKAKIEAAGGKAVEEGFESEAD
jgi:large subunit ribosomal protein L15